MTWLLLIIRFFSLVIDLKIVGGRLVAQILSDKFNVEMFLGKKNVSGWIAEMKLCCRFNSSKLICVWNSWACSSLSSLFFKFNTLSVDSALNEFSLMFLKRFPDKSKCVNFSMFSKRSGEKFVSLLFSNWRIRRHRKLTIACGWITKILFWLRFNSSKHVWCWNIRWQMMPILLSHTERNFICLRGRNVSQCKSLIWLLERLKVTRLPGPTNASLLTCVMRLFSILTSFRSIDLRKSLAGSSVSWLSFKLT